MSGQEYFATPTPRALHAPTQAPAVTPPAANHRTRWLVALGAVAVLGVVVTALVVAWNHSSGPTRPDPATARLFGQQTRVELPAPVTADECSAAAKAFPAIDSDAQAQAAFVDGCMHGG